MLIVSILYQTRPMNGGRDCEGSGVTGELCNMYLSYKSGLCSEDGTVRDQG